MINYLLGLVLGVLLLVIVFNWFILKMNLKEIIEDNAKEMTKPCPFQHNIMENRDSSEEAEVMNSSSSFKIQDTMGYPSGVLPDITAMARSTNAPDHWTWCSGCETCTNQETDDKNRNYAELIDKIRVARGDDRIYPRYNNLN